MSEDSFRVFGLDRQLYGPVSATVLADWARDGRVTKDSWIHRAANDGWFRAEVLPELESHFHEVIAKPEAPGTATGPAASKSGVPAKVLNRLKVFGEMSAAELEPFARVMVEESYRPFTYIVQQGSHGDAMFFVIQGKVGVSTRGQVTESFLVALNIGDTFGEMSLFDPGPRSADVRAENDVVLLKLTADSLRAICDEAPAAASRFLWNMSRILSSRIRTMDKRAASAKDMDAAGKAVR